MLPNCTNDEFSQTLSEALSLNQHLGQYTGMTNDQSPKSPPCAPSSHCPPPKGYLCLLCAVCKYYYAGWALGVKCEGFQISLFYFYFF